MGYEQDLDQLVTFLEQTHPDLYRNITKEAFYTEVDNLKNKRMIKEQFQLELMKLVAKINDPHTTVNIPNYDIPFRIMPIGDKYYIVADYVNVESSYVGKSITAINGIQVDSYLKNFDEYIAFDNEAWKKTSYCDLLSNLYL